ncbi:MAG: metalloregulator ArsR/SmtB family transcription factor [Candidatus Pacebacteria bacterium]|nr:metalloregulator ArsR/SmtB family transcription factor [Candidatus Paceibacterota bacterium]
MKPKCCKDSQTIEDTRQTIELLKVLAEENRLHILCILKKKEHCVCQIIEYLELSQSLVSHHLKSLKDTGLIQDEKRGLWVYYSLTPRGKKIANLISKIHDL